MSLYGATELEFSQHRGVCFDTSAAELEPSLAADVSDIDFDGDLLRSRLGRALYNTTSPTGSRVRAIGAHVPASGTRSILMHAGAAWYADTDANGSFDLTIASGLTGGVPADLIPWRANHYLANSADGLYKWTGSGAGSAVSLLAAPTLKPLLQLEQTVIETFDSNTGGSAWTSTSANLAASNEGSKFIQGTGSLKLTASAAGAEGGYIHRAWSAGTQDLSGVKEIWVWAFTTVADNAFQIAVSDNDGNFDFGKFPSFTLTKKNQWVLCRVPLDGLSPATRTASTKLGIRWVNARNYGASRFVYFDRALAVGPLVSGDYKYWVTYADLDGDGNVVAESNPSTTIAASTTPLITVSGPGGEVGTDDEVLPAKGINVVVPTPTASSVDSIRVYRFLTSGQFRRPRLVKALAKTTDWTGASTTTAEAVSIGETAIDLTSATGFAVNDYAIMGGTEVVKITAIATNTVTVTKGQYGTLDQAHNSGATFVKAAVFTDTLDDGSIAVQDTDELIMDGRMVPPPADTYCAVNNRLLAGAPTLSGTKYPQRVYLSEFDYPENFAAQQLPDFPGSAGWFEIGTGHHIRRILEFDGMAVLFTDRSVWSLQGSGWDDFSLQKRADFGLDAREAVVVQGRLIYFLSQDGIRVLAPNQTRDDVWETWLISEPVQSKLRAIPAAYRGECAAGLDERDRVVFSLVRPGQTLPDRELVFNPQEPGALSPQPNKQRPGWTYYARGHGVYYRLPRRNPDAGQLLAGDNTAAFLYYLNRNGSDTALTTDVTGTHASSSSEADIAWYWQSAASDAGPGHTLGYVYVSVLADPAASLATTLAEDVDAAETAVDVSDASGLATGDYLQVGSELLLITNKSGNTLTVSRAQGGTEAAAHANGASVYLVSVWTATPVLEGDTSGSTQLLNLGTDTAGIVTRERRFGAGVRGRYLQLKLSGTHGTQQVLRSARVGVWRR